MDYPTNSPENTKMEEEKNNIKYSAEYIRKYLYGQLSDQAMQALEKAALEDPFLADAIEGIEESRKHAVSFESGVADLRTKLKERISQKKRKSGILFQLSKWPVAASFMVVIGLAVFMVTYVNKKQKVSQTAPLSDSSSVTLNKSSQENSVEDSVKRDEPVIASVKSRDIRKNIAARKDSTSSVKANESQSDKKTGNYLAADSSGFFSDTIHNAEKFETLARRDVTPPVAASAKQGFYEERNPGMVSNPTETPSGNNIIRGHVINDQGKPVPYAKVNIRGSNKHVFTDTAGFFKLYMKDPRLAALVFVQPAGYESASVELIPDSNITHTIQLHSSATDADLKTLPDEKISPFVTGWDAFYHFIDSNKKINTKDSLMKGEEVVSFTLYSDGKLSPIRIEESLSAAHDKEILRLILLAPALKLQEKKRIRCVLHIQFK